MAEAKNRLVWSDLPPAIQRTIQSIAGAPVASARSMIGGFSPGLASLLRLANGDLVFAKASCAAWPIETEFCRNEAQVASALPATLSAPRLRGACDDGDWIVLVFDGLDGHEPAQPWRPPEVRRAVAMLAGVARVGSPSPIALGTDHPRFGGWRRVADDPGRTRRLAETSRWAARHLDQLIALDDAGLVAAQGESLVHFDCYPHNIVMTPARVYLVDWPHARIGNPLVDLVSLLASVSADGLDPEAFAGGHQQFRDADSRLVDALIAAHAGFCLAGALHETTPGMQPIADEKLRLGLGSLVWLRARLDGR